MKVSVVDLVFDAPRLLEWLGWSITKRPHLLGAHPSLTFPLAFARACFELLLPVVVMDGVWLSSVGPS